MIKDWIGFNKDAGSEMMAKVGQWNLAVAVRAIAEAVEDYLHKQDQEPKGLPPISPGESYEVILCNGMKFIGSVDFRGPAWVEICDANGKSQIVRTSEIA